MEGSGHMLPTTKPSHHRPLDADGERPVRADRAEGTGSSRPSSVSRPTVGDYGPFPVRSTGVEIVVVGTEILRVGSRERIYYPSLICQVRIGM